MLKIYGQFWIRAFDYSGRSDVMDFWVPTIFNSLLLFLILPFLGSLTFLQQAQTAQLFGLVLGIIFLIPTLSLETRRLRDAGLPLILVGLEPLRFLLWVLGFSVASFIIDIIILVLMTRKSQDV